MIRSFSPIFKQTDMSESQLYTESPIAKMHEDDINAKMQRTDAGRAW